MNNEVTGLPELPNGWTWTTVSTAIEKVPLSGRKLKQSEYQEEGILPVIDQGQIFVGGYTDRRELKAPCEPPVIVFGDHTKIIKYVSFDFVAGADGVKAIRPLNAFFPKLFYYFLQAIELPEKGYARHFQFLEKSFIPLPPLTEQQRIVAKIEELFTRLDAGVEALKKIKAQLNRYRQAVLKHAFEGNLTEEWRQTHKDQLEPASVLLERIKQERHKTAKGKYKEPSPLDISDLPELPESWAWTQLSAIAESMKNGIYKPPSYYSGNGIACLRMYNIENGLIVWKDIKRMNLSTDEISEYELLPGDILVNRVNSRELVGKAAVIPTGLEPCVYESKNIRLRLYLRYADSTYVNHWFLLSSQEYFNRNAQQTVGMASINQGQLGSMPIPIPQTLEQYKIVEEIQHRFSEAGEIEKTVDHSLKQAERLRHSILKRAFEGKLVPQDPNDEPAEKLLERIKLERLQHEKAKCAKRDRGGPSEKTRKGQPV